MSYDNWLKEQPKEFQDAALGKNRGAAYRSGQYKADRYREYGKPMNLAQLNETDDLCLRGNHAKSTN